MSDNTRGRTEYPLQLSKNIDETITLVTNIVGESDDIIQRDFLVGKKIKASLFYVDGLADKDRIEKNTIEPLLKYSVNEKQKSILLEQLLDEVVFHCDVRKEKSFEKSIFQLLSGEALLVIDGIDEVLLFATRSNNERSIDEPESEVVVRGPRDGFIESLQTNVMLMRRRVRDQNFVVQYGNIGRRSKKDFAILYIKGITNQEYIDKVRYRISCIDMDDVVDTGSLEQLIEDNPLSIFPQTLRTERPDRTVNALMNGQVVVLLDGSPFSLMAPVTFHMLFQSPEDYYDRWQIGSLIRVLRYLGAFIAMFLPALYIAMVSYQQGMIPTTLALSIAGTREGVPFPGFIEAFFMEITLELLREAGVRLPRPVGQAIGIVGGLVIGDAAVRAGIVSPVMVIVVALTAIASFVLPSYNVSISLRILRFSLMIAASLFGLYGILIAYIFINIHLVGLKSFGTYYTSPFAPYRYAELLDTVIRAPLNLLSKRFEELKPDDQRRSK